MEGREKGLPPYLQGDPPCVKITGQLQDKTFEKSKKIRTMVLTFGGGGDVIFRKGRN